jgi:hypothetical protein
MDSLWNDLRFGLRTMLKDRVSLGIAVLALALGIGSTTAIFRVIDNVLLEPFPYTDGQRLTIIRIHDSGSNDDDWRGAPPVFVMSYKLWQRRSLGDGKILGKSFTLDGKPTTLIGIMPKRFALWGAEVW